MKASTTILVLSASLASALPAASFGGLGGGSSGGLDGQWSCTVPSGYTYTGIQKVPASACGGGNNFGTYYKYMLTSFKSGIWVCDPYGHGYSKLQNVGAGVCASQPSYKYLLQ